MTLSFRVVIRFIDWLKAMFSFHGRLQLEAKKQEHSPRRVQQNGDTIEVTDVLVPTITINSVDDDHSDFVIGKEY